MRLYRLFTFLAFICIICLSANSRQSLIPDTPSNAPDYFCTWSTQGYVVNFSGADNTRAAINEQNMFGNGKYEGWANFFPKIRSDLYFVMDDSWDIPQNVNTGKNEYLGLVELDETRFPSFKGTPQERLKALNEKVKSYGWKGVGGWICAQESATDNNYKNQNEYWIERLKAAHYAGFNYWKVDWGHHDHNLEWRKMLSALGHTYAPNLFIEHAMDNKYIEFSDVFRTYDVESITSAPVTIQRICNLLNFQTKGKAKGIINCEDEPYIAAGLGCAIGIMRYPFIGSLPNGQQDNVFPPVGRDLKNRMDEVTRAIRWHRIAEPFGVNGDARIDSVKLKDTWVFKQGESWISRPEGEVITAEAPARISRGLPLPHITNLHATDQPFVMASRYPNGAIAIVTQGRTLGREYKLKCETVSVELPELNAPVGIFGDYKELVLIYPQNINKKGLKIYGQDLAGETPANITKQVKIEGNKLIIPGSLIREIGLAAATLNDISDPGMVMKIFTK